jgi:hypothetical protein
MTFLLLCSQEEDSYLEKVIQSIGGNEGFLVLD